MSHGLHALQLEHMSYYTSGSDCLLHAADSVIKTKSVFAPEVPEGIAKSLTHILEVYLFGSKLFCG